MGGHLWAKNAGMTVEDLDSLALAGLWHAAQRFDPSRNLKFSTYASTCARGYVMTGTNNFRWGGKVGADKNRDFATVLKCGNDPEAGPTIDAFAATDDGVADDAARNEIVERVQAAIARLPERHQIVARMRILEERTVIEVAAALGRTRARAYQIEIKVRARLAELPADMTEVAA